MSTTTSTALRQAIIDATIAVVPTQRSTDRFRVHRDESEFSAWAGDNPQACFRVFSVEDVYDYTMPQITNGDVQWLETTFELRIAYPMTMATNADDGMRDIRDWIDEDLRQLDSVVGLRGHVNYSVGSLISSVPSITSQPPVYIGAIDIVFGYYRSM